MDLQNAKLLEFFKQNPVHGSLSEWGAPLGQLGRLIPALLIKQLASPCLWIRDNRNYEVYPSFWRDLGLDLKQVFFLYDDDPLKNLRQAFKSSEFKILVLDIERFITPANMNFLAKYSREEKVTCLLIRKYFLSPKNGNPFSKHRFNCSYSLRRNQIQISTVKGHQQPLSFNMQEVLHG